MKSRPALAGFGLIPLFVLAHFVHHLLTTLPAPLIPFIRDEFNLDYAQAGGVIAAFSLAYGISNIPSGWLADRLGPVILITIGISGVALGGLFIGLSQTYIMLLVFMVFMGICAGGYHPSAAPLISAVVPPEKRGRALGIHLVGGSASHFVTPLVAAATAVALGWRSSFIILAIPTMLFGIGFYFFLRRLVAAKKIGRKTAGAGEEITSEPHHILRLVTTIFLSNFAMGTLQSIVILIPLFAVDMLGYEKETAAALLAMAFVSGFWAHPLGGYLSDRFGRIQVIVTVVLLSAPAIYLLNFVSHGLGISALLVVMGTLIFMRMPAAESYIVSHTSQRHRSSVLGIYYFGNVEGIGIMTPVIGFLIDQYGFYTSFSIASGTLAAVALVCGLILWRTRR